MDAAIKILTFRLAEIEKTIQHLTDASALCYRSVYTHPDIKTILLKKHEIEVALRALALLPKTEPTDPDILLYKFKTECLKSVRKSQALRSIAS